jgi:hypothetical protein
LHIPFAEGGHQADQLFPVGTSAAYFFLKNPGAFRGVEFG